MTAGKYVKKPIPVEAIQYTGTNQDEVTAFAGTDVYFEAGRMYVKTLEGVHTSPNMYGDYVVKGVKGEFYICEKQIFEETYDPV